MTVIRNFMLIFFLTCLSLSLFIIDNHHLNSRNTEHNNLQIFTQYDKQIEPSSGSFQNSAEPSVNFTAEDPLPDKKIAEKYGLIIPPPDTKIEPAPEWLQNSEMFTFDWAVWKNQKFILNDTSITRIVRIRASYGLREVTEHYPVETIDSFDSSIIKGVSLFTQALHCRKAFEEAHKQGVRAIPYVHFSDIHTCYTDQDVFFFQHPEILLKDERGRWLHMPMDGSSRAFRFMTCANSTKKSCQSLSVFT